jgi:hypothetical protein
VTLAGFAVARPRIRRVEAGAVARRTTARWFVGVRPALRRKVLVNDPGTVTWSVRLELSG